MKTISCAAIGIAAFFMFFCLTIDARASRIKDIASLEGVRPNQLVGYGLVVGLNGSGDSAGTQFTVQSLVNMMQRMGLTVDMNKVKVKNVAAVMVTADLPAFAKTGNAIDAMISSMGDAKSLVGGSLLMTPLKGPDGNVYAVAQGALSTAAIAFGGKAASVQKNHPTVGRIPGGALVEKEAPSLLAPGNVLTYRLAQADFTTAARMAQVINKRYGTQLAKAQDSGAVSIAVPPEQQNQVANFVAALETLNIEPDLAARIVVNEKTGTIVMGSDVRVATVAVSHANLNLMIRESAAVSQPGALAKGETAVVPKTEIESTETPANLVVMKMGTSIGDIARALNAIGATPRDLIAIFQAIKSAGALHAELVIL